MLPLFSLASGETVSTFDLLCIKQYGRKQPDDKDSYRYANVPIGTNPVYTSVQPRR